MPRAKRITSLYATETELRNVLCKSLTRMQRASAIHLDISLTPHKVSAGSDDVEEDFDPDALIVKLVFLDRRTGLISTSRSVEMDDCFSVKQLPSATINVQAIAESMTSREVDFEDAIWRLFSIVAAKTATLRVELTRDGDLVLSLSFGTYESEAVIPIKECEELFVPVEDDD